MLRYLALSTLLACALLAREPLADRIAHNDPAKYRKAGAVHGGAGELHYMGLFDATTLGTNLLFVHRGLLQPKSSIGNHFHHGTDEMFVILDNEAQFTMDGRTSRLAGPAGAPLRMGHSHALYNPTDRPTEWMNISVSRVKGKGDSFDLGDARVDVALDPKPVFISMRLDRSLLRPVANLNGGQGTARYRRVFQPEVFVSNWAYTDHLLLPPDTSAGKHMHAGVEEFYYVMSGEGSVRVGNETAAIKKGDAVPIRFNDVHSFTNTGSGDLEFLVVGIAREKGILDSVDVK